MKGFVLQCISTYSPQCEGKNGGNLLNLFPIEINLLQEFSRNGSLYLEGSAERRCTRIKILI